MLSCIEILKQTEAFILKWPVCSQDNFIFKYFFAHEEPLSSVVYYLDTSYLMAWTLRAFSSGTYYSDSPLRFLNSQIQDQCRKESSKEQPP